MSPDLGDTRRNGCPESLGWDSGVDLESVEEGEEEEEEEGDGENMVDRLRQVIESPLWALVRDFLTSEECPPHAHNGNKMEKSTDYIAPLQNSFPSLILNGQVCDTITDNSVDSTKGFLNLGKNLT